MCACVRKRQTTFVCRGLKLWLNSLLFGSLFDCNRKFNLFLRNQMLKKVSFFLLFLLLLLFSFLCLVIVSCMFVCFFHFLVLFVYACVFVFVCVCRCVCECIFFFPCFFFFSYSLFYLIIVKFNIFEPN